MRLVAFLILLWPILAHSQLIDVTLGVTDLNGDPLGSALPGMPFVLRVYVEDLRAAPQGVFAGYVDVFFDEELIVHQGQPAIGPHYPNGQSGTASAGLIDEAGGFDGITPLGAGRFLLFEQQFEPTGPGLVTFVSDPPDVLPQHDLLLFGLNTPVAPEQVSFGQLTLPIEPLPGNIFADGFESVFQATRH